MGGRQSVFRVYGWELRAKSFSRGHDLAALTGRTRADFLGTLSSELSSREKTDGRHTRGRKFRHHIYLSLFLILASTCFVAPLSPLQSNERKLEENKINT